MNMPRCRLLCLSVLVAVAAAALTIPKTQRLNGTLSNDETRFFSLPANATHVRLSSVGAADGEIQATIVRPGLAPVTLNAPFHYSRDLQARDLESGCVFSSTETPLDTLMSQQTEVQVLLVGFAKGHSVQFVLEWEEGVSSHMQPDGPDLTAMVNCGAWRHHYFEIPSEDGANDTSQATWIIEVRTQNQTHHNGIVFLSHNRCPTPIDYHITQSFQYLSILSLSGTGSRIDSKTHRSQQPLQAGTYCVGVAADVWTGAFNSELVPTRESWNGCCNVSMAYSVRVYKQLNQVTIAWGYTAPLMVATILFTVFGIVLFMRWGYCKRRSKSDEYLVDEYAPLSDGHDQLAFPERISSTPSSSRGNRIITPDLFTTISLDTPTAAGTLSLNGRARYMPSASSASNLRTLEETLNRTVSVLDDAELDPRRRITSHFRPLSGVIAAVGMFSAVPALQFVYVQMVGNFSESNFCHYNYRCKMDVQFFGLFSIAAFNNVYSNIAYILVAIFLIWYLKYCPRVVQTSAKRGVANAKSIYYGIAVAILYEGIFSALYHMCPSRWNFQFDSLFMFFISVLLIAAIHQKRHPCNVPATASFVFSLAVVILLNVYGVWLGIDKDNNSWILFWIPFFILYFFFSIYATLRFYFNRDYARARLPWVWSILKQTVSHRYQKPLAVPKNVPRFVMLLCTNIAQWILVITAALQTWDTSFFFLVHIQLYLFCYFIYYGIQKLRHHERIGWGVTSFLFITVLTMMIAMFVFEEYPASSKLLPIDDSRSFNHNCKILFYDAHDVWHFLSAIALLMVTLTVYHIDDDLKDVSTKDIKVF